MISNSWAVSCFWKRRRLLVAGLDQFSDQRGCGDDADAVAELASSQTQRQCDVRLGKAGEQGEALAQCELGDLYAHGRGVPQDYAKAAVWYRKAAEQGLAQAQYWLGLFYRDGLGVPQDDEQSEFLFRKARDQGTANGGTVLP